MITRVTVDDLLPNGSLFREPEMQVLRKAVEDAVVGLIGKGYYRAEVMEAIMCEAHTTAVGSILKLRVTLNKGEAPWGDLK